jgi:hypothetical protein
MWWIIIENLIEYLKSLPDFANDEVHAGMENPIKIYPCTEVIWDGDLDPELHYQSKGKVELSLDQYVKVQGNSTDAYQALFFIHKKTLDALRGFQGYAKDNMNLALKITVGSIVNITGATSRPATGSTMPIEIEWRGVKHYEE